MGKTAENRRASQSDYVVLEGVPWVTYEGLIDAIGEYHLRHTYDQGTLEMRRLLYGVSWKDYLELLSATADLSLPHTYNEGTLEIMSPRKDHDWVAKLIARMIEAYALVADLPIQSIGSTTLRASTGDRGLQPDQTYYLASEPLVRCKEAYDPKTDPPPDLAIEVDVTSTSVERMPIFAAIGVPEVWRVESGRVRFYRRKSKTAYEAIEHSIAFPFLTPADLMRFAKRRAEIGENAIVREFVEWAKKASVRKPK